MKLKEIYTRVVVDQGPGPVLFSVHKQQDSLYFTWEGNTQQGFSKAIYKGALSTHV